MKKLFFFCATLVALSSCSKSDCITCMGQDVCQSDYEAGTGSVTGAPTWASYKSIALAAGCTQK